MPGDSAEDIRSPFDICYSMASIRNYFMQTKPQRKFEWLELSVAGRRNESMGETIERNNFDQSAKSFQLHRFVSTLHALLNAQRPMLMRT